uniref:WASH-7_N domain-containing protein n=1 Tax=Rhabditophanes sp. KR3021 TaxID=114890 RepID=A0AC35U9W3_9BILA
MAAVHYSGHEITQVLTNLTNSLELMDRVVYKGNNSFRHAKFFNAFKQIHRQLWKHILRNNLQCLVIQTLKQIPMSEGEDIHPKSILQLNKGLIQINLTLNYIARIKKGAMVRFVKETSALLDIGHHIAFCQVSLGVLGEVNGEINKLIPFLNLYKDTINKSLLVN